MSVVKMENNLLEELAGAYYDHTMDEGGDRVSRYRRFHRMMNEVGDKVVRRRRYYSNGVHVLVTHGVSVRVRNVLGDHGPLVL